ncbi:MAG: phosphate ABC transporter substrate-binding protein PstS [Nitrospirota bacterium]
MKNILRLTLALALALALVMAFGMTAEAEIINGAGATFPYPLYSKWFYQYEKNTGIKINYQSIGSGGGIQQVKAGTVDFGASDAPLPKEEIDKHGLIQFPTVAGAVAVAYNLPGIPSGLKLTSEIVADIYLGKVTKWTDQRIREINPNLRIPDLPLIVVHRSDGSGTTNIFTWFLSDINQEWKTRVGSGTSVKWPVGLGGKGNEGVAGLVRQTRGAIGYVELAYALQTKMSYAMLRNRDGNFVYPTIETTKAAAANADVPPEFYVKFTYSKGKDSYPIAGFTYLILRKNMDRSKLSTILKFVEWAYKNGDGHAKELHYVPMPESLKIKVLTALKKL